MVVANTIDSDGVTYCMTSSGHPTIHDSTLGDRSRAGFRGAWALYPNVNPIATTVDPTARGVNSLGTSIFCLSVMANTIMRCRAVQYICKCN